MKPRPAPNLVVLALILLVSLPGALPAGTVADCASDSPARPVPQFDNELAPGVSLWPLDSVTGKIKLQPAGLAPGITRQEVPILPANRDSTDFVGVTVPGEFSGHELFRDLAIAGSREESARQAEWLAVVYGAGLEVWDLSTDPAAPTLISQRDGWTSPSGPGDWAQFPAVGEDHTFINAVDVVQVGTTLYIGIAARRTSGFSVWTFDTVSGALEQQYQDPWNINGEDVSMILGAGGEILAYVADRGMLGSEGGVKIYDVLEATTSGLCIEPDGSYNCGVYLGQVGSLTKVHFVSTLRVGDEIYLAASDGDEAGGPLALEIWQVGAPSTLKFSGLGTRVFSPQLFSYAGSQYLALVETVGGSDPEQMRLHDVGHCLDADGCAGLGDPKATETLKNGPNGNHFLDVSFAGGQPFLHYGVDTTNLAGAGFERLWELGGLPADFALDTLPELTDGGGTYLDPCSGNPVDYFGDYYMNNDFGLNRFNPRHALLTGPFLYRAANSVLDVHTVFFAPTFSDGFESGDCSAWDGGCE